MSTYTDDTHDPHLRSWVDPANDPAADFPLQNLPLGVFRRAGSDEKQRIGVAIGDSILDVHGCIQHNLLEGTSPETACSLSAAALNDFMGRGQPAWREARHAISRLLRHDNARLRDDANLRGQLIVEQSLSQMFVPAVIGDYTDFYASIHHATNVGSMFRPNEPLMPNYKHLPVGYHGRSSTIVVSGTPIRRPTGQVKPDDAAMPEFRPTRLLDYEMELGALVGSGNAMGERITMKKAAGRLFGVCIVNDWSARDVQKWEYQPLGPFNSKNFGTSISPWVVTLDAMAPFRLPGPPRGETDPPVLDYLQGGEDCGLDITVEVYLSSDSMREQGIPPMRLSRATFANMYWTFAQMLAHHTSTGCAMRPGDLIASGTVSGPEEENRGCLLERTWRGQNPINLPDGTQRKFLHDGDEVIMRAFCERNSEPRAEASGLPPPRRIGFGECRGIIVAAK